jgi:hypothetical protein
MTAKQHWANKQCLFKFLILFGALYQLFLGTARAQSGWLPPINNVIINLN